MLGWCIYMKNMARLVLFFSLSFIILFAIAGGISYLQLALEPARAIPRGPPVALWQFIAALQKILPLILYVSILLGLSYTARRLIPLPAAMAGLFILAAGAALGSTLGILQLKSLDSPRFPLFLSSRSGETLGAPGLILSKRDTVLVVLGEPGQAGSPRVVSLPGRPLLYQEQPLGLNNTITALPEAPFRREESLLMSGLLRDSALAAEQFEARLEGGLRSFALYAGALILLLVSLRFVLDLSSWPLANFFCGALVFRGILAFQTFIDSRMTRDFILGFFNESVRGEFLSPAIFAGLALLILLYTLLVNLAMARFTAARTPGQGSSRARKQREAPQ